MRNIISTSQFKKPAIDELLKKAEEMEVECKKGSLLTYLKNKIIAVIFFEPSTRTRLSFEAAAIKLGANVISVENGEMNSSAYKGESLEDTIRTIATYADAIIMRHHKSGGAEIAAGVSNKPIINAGDGANEHPSQALLDLYTIQKEHRRLDDLSIVFVGDILNSRPIRSLVPLLMLYPNNKFYFVSPKELMLSPEYRAFMQEKNVDFEELNSLENVLPQADVLYMTRVQKERFSNVADYEKVKDAFLLKKSHTENLKKEAIIMHPLPRVNEIDVEIDQNPRAAYFRQVENGLYMRMAMLLYSFGLS